MEITFNKCSIIFLAFFLVCQGYDTLYHQSSKKEEIRGTMTDRGAGQLGMSGFMDDLTITTSSPCASWMGAELEGVNLG